MVTACRSYITENGTVLIWDQDAKDLIRKIQVTKTPSRRIRIKAVLLLIKTGHHVIFRVLSLAGLHQLVPEVSVLLPHSTINRHTRHEALQDFRNTDFKEV